MKQMAILLVVLLAGAWFARPAASAGRAGAVYRLEIAPAFDSADAIRTWLDSRSDNGFVLKTEVVVLRGEDSKLRLVPAAAVGKPPVTDHLLFQSGRN